MKYLPGRPIEKPGSGGGMIFFYLFLEEGVQDKSSHSIHSPGTEAEGRPSQTLGRLSLLEGQNPGGLLSN